MDLCIFKDISINSKEMESARNILSYTLHLEYEKVHKNHSTSNLLYEKEKNYDTYIEDLFEQCNSICSSLFHINSFTFFGNSSINTHNFYQDLCLDKTFWESSIKYHCSISSLYTLLHTFLKDERISPYTVNTYAKENGYFYFHEKNYLDSSNKTFKRYIQEKISTTASNTSGNFSKTYRTFYDKLSSVEQALFNTYTKKDSSKDSKLEFFLENSDLSYFLFDNRNHFINLRKSYEEQSIQSVHSFFKNMSDLHSSYNKVENKVDLLLLQYKAERYYNFSMTSQLIYSIFDDVWSKNKNSLVSFSPEFLVSCFNLPNVFSRNIYLLYALNSYDNKFLNESIFYKRLQNAGPLVFAQPETPKETHLFTWLELYKKFFSFFSFVVFPVYEKCFFLLLYDSLKESLPENETLDNNKIIKAAIDILYKYINSHIDQIKEGEFCTNSLAGPPPKEDFIYQIKIPKQEYFSDKNQKINENSFLKNILMKQNNLFHPVTIPGFGPDYFGIKEKRDHKSALITFYTNSIIEHISRVNDIDSPTK